MNGNNNTIIPTVLNLFRKEDFPSPVTPPNFSQKNPFPQIDTFIKTVNAGTTVSSEIRNNLPEFRKHSAQVEQWYTESLEKYCDIFDTLPRSSLEAILGDNTEIFFKLKVLKQGLKAKIGKNRKSISKLEMEEVHDLTNQFNEPIPMPIPSSSSKYSDSISSFENVRPSTFEAVRPSNFDSNTKPNNNAYVAAFNDDDDFDEFDMLVSRSGVDLGISSIDLATANVVENDFSSTSSPAPTAVSQNSQKSNSSHMGNFYSGTKNDGITGEFDGYGYPHSELMQTSLRYTFGLKSFRPNQLQAINAIMLGHDCFILMPTGGGKSLCYQLPATLTESVTMIVSPLKSLILDQVNKLQALDINARNLSGEQTLQEINTIYMELEATPPRVKVLYVTPEKISASNRLQATMQKLYNKGNISRFVIDEAHCVR